MQAHTDWLAVGQKAASGGKKLQLNLVCSPRRARNRICAASTTGRLTLGCLAGALSQIEGRPARWGRPLALGASLGRPNPAASEAPVRRLSWRVCRAK